MDLITHDKRYRYHTYVAITKPFLIILLIPF